MALAWKDLPRIFRHSVVAIHSKLGGADSVLRAMKIARASLQDNGYLYNTPLVGDGVLDNIRLTAKGWKRNQEHMREGVSGDKKDLIFKGLFEQIQPLLYELDGPGGHRVHPEPDEETRDVGEKLNIKGKGE